ncbi:hypothetical protein [Massilia sp.]|uniref:hypothetical protein n=1 Tax=Massilia sp. TaxID=1882437 RepID=UPI00352D34C1
MDHLLHLNNLRCKRLQLLGYVAIIQHLDLDKCHGVAVYRETTFSGVAGLPKQNTRGFSFAHVLWRAYIEVNRIEGFFESMMECVHRLIFLKLTDFASPGLSITRLIMMNLTSACKRNIDMTRNIFEYLLTGSEYASVEIYIFLHL